MPKHSKKPAAKQTPKPFRRPKGVKLTPAAYKKAAGKPAFTRRPGESWSAARNRGARLLGFADYTAYRLEAGRRKGKTIQQARGHGGPGDREKPAATFRPGKRAAAIFKPKLREATTTRTPAFFYDLLPYTVTVRVRLVPSVIAAAKRVQREHGRVAYRFFRFGTKYDEGAEPDYYYDDTILLGSAASWITFRADLTLGIRGLGGDSIVGVWLYGRAQ